MPGCTGVFHIPSPTTVRTLPELQIERPSPLCAGTVPYTFLAQAGPHGRVDKLTY
ncbi:hypothetical protein C8Q77DRAFT_1097565 [Trametes polyzona]|nr:hypothetical protein C8Q77DRAFT_1097565 [Trametes polyzona]